MKPFARRFCEPLQRYAARPIRSFRPPASRIIAASIKGFGSTGPYAKFKSFEESTAEDWAIISGEYMAFAKDLPDRVLAHLRLLDGDFGGFPVDLVERADQRFHGYSSGSRARQANIYGTLDNCVGPVNRARLRADGVLEFAGRAVVGLGLMLLALRLIVESLQSCLCRRPIDLDRCIGCHICADVCPTGYIQMGLGE